MFGNRIATAAIVTLVVGLALPGMAGMAGGETFVSISATVTPDQPTVDDEFAVDVRFERPSSDSGPQEVDEVAVYRTDRPGEPLGTVDSSTYVRSGSSQTVQVDELELNETGVYDLRVEATFVDGDGLERTVTTPLTVPVYSPDPLVEVETADAVPGAWRPVNVSVANRLDEPLRGVTVSLAGEQVEFDQRERVTSQIQGSGSFAAAFDGRTEEAGVHPVNVTVDYEDPDGEIRSVTRTVEADFTGPSNPGAIQLTGVSTSQRGGSVEISGSAANTGSSAVEGVLVSVDETAHVQPAQPQEEYFVGPVEGSEFASFTVNAQVSENATEIPLSVRYVVDDVEQTANRTVTHSAAGSAEPATRGADGGGIGLLPVAGVLLVVAILGGAWYRRRQ